MENSLRQIIFEIRKWIKYQIYWPLSRGEWVLGRHACLGYDVIKHHPGPVKLLNFQKARVDYFIAILEGQKCQTKFRQVKEHLKRGDILPLLAELQFLNSIPNKSPKYILMDSYSELTDQLFEHKKGGWWFLANYSDIRVTNNFNLNYKIKGLLDLQALSGLYEKLFDHLSSKYKNVPIIFMHFPKKLEARGLFTDRHDMIKTAIHDIQSKFPNLHNIHIDESEVTYSDIDEFPYHFNDETYKIFYEKIKNLNII